MSDQASSLPTQPRRRSRINFRFGLRSFFVLVAIVSVAGGVLHQFWWTPWQQQKHAVELMNAHAGMGEGEMGDCKYESTKDFPWWKTRLASLIGLDSVTRVTHAYAAGTGFPMDISTWKGLKSVDHVLLEEAIIDDLSVLCHLPNVKFFCVIQSGEDIPPGNAGLEVLGQLEHLETVRLSESSFPFNDRIFDAICKAKTIREFAFDARGLTTLKPLTKLAELEELELWVGPWQQDIQNLDAIGQLHGLKALRLRLYTNEVFGFSFLKNLPDLETCEISGNLTADELQLIPGYLPKECKISLNPGGLTSQ